MEKHLRSFAQGMALAFAAVACGSDPEPAAVAPDAGRASAARERTAEPASQENHPPRVTFVRFEPEEPATGDTVRAVVEASDEDGDSLWYRYVWTVGGEPAGSNSRELVLRGVAKGERLEISVTASDGKDESVASTAFTRLSNAPPRLEGVAIGPGAEIMAGVDVVARPDARDADGDPLEFRYEWTVNGRPVRGDGPVLPTRHLRRGDVARVSVVADDGEDQSDLLTSREIPIVNAPPRIVSVPGAPTDDGVFRYQVRAEDPDGDSDLQFHLEDAPDGMDIDPRSGAITWQPAPEQAGTFAVSVVVDDLQGGRSQQTVEVVVGSPDGVAPPASEQ